MKLAPRLAFHAIVCSTLAAQQFAPLPEQPTSTGLLPPILAGDVNGDGLEDIVTRTRILIRQDDDGYRFVDGAPFEVAPPYDAVLVDVDGDGDLDWVGAFEERNHLYLNDGSGQFDDATTTNMPNFSRRSYGVAAGDVDGDGDVDLFFANTDNTLFTNGAQNALYLNDGTGAFSDATIQLPQRIDPTQDVALGDIDGDGDLDAVYGQAASQSGSALNQNQIVLNDGSGTFTDPVNPLLPSNLMRTSNIEFCDFDGDGDADLYVRDQLFFASLPIDSLLFNDGTGLFSDVTDSNLIGESATGRVTVGDIDDDGDFDVLAGNVRLNDGTGVLQSVPDSWIGTGALTDIDADGDLDMVASDGAYENVGGGQPEARGLPDPFAGPFPFAMEDVNSDSVSDIVWRPLTPTPLAPFARTRAITTMDFEGDGDDDCIDIKSNGSVIRWFDHGADVFFGIRDTQPDEIFLAIDQEAVGDIDGDGDLDVFVSSGIRPYGQGISAPCEGSWQPRVFLNDGVGNFTELAGAVPNYTLPVYSAALADVDGDGDLDAALGIGGDDCAGQDRLLINDGSGQFVDETAARLPVIVEGASVLSFADSDGDGDQDLLVQTLSLTWFFVAQTPTYLLVNDGSGHFTTTVPLPDNGNARFADIDGDGDPDVAGLYVLLNQGQNQFVDQTQVLFGSPTVAASSFTDIDLDGDLDAVGFATNLDRQVELPVLARTGQPFRIRVHSQPLFTPVATAAVPLLSFGTAVTPTPFGVLGLDTASWTALPPLAFAPGDTFTDATPVVPDSDALVGVEVWVQALIARSGTTESEILLTNTSRRVLYQPWIR